MTKFSLSCIAVGLLASTIAANAQSAPGATKVDLTTTLVDVNTFLGIGGHSTSTGPGGVVIVEYKVNNLGSPASSAGNIAFYVSKVPRFTPSAKFIVYADLFDAVPASGSTQNIFANITLPTTLAPGAYYIIVVANYDHKVAEMNYNNNPSNALPISIVAPSH